MIIPMSFSCSGTVDPEDFGVVEGFIVVLVDIEVDPDFGVEGVKSVVLIVVVVTVVVVDVVDIEVDPDFDVEGVSSLLLIVVVTNVCLNGFTIFRFP